MQYLLPHNKNNYCVNIGVNMSELHICIAADFRFIFLGHQMKPTD